MVSALLWSQSVCVLAVQSLTKSLQRKLNKTSVVLLSIQILMLLS